jgi:hypothetical protein
MHVHLPGIVRYGGITSVADPIRLPVNSTSATEPEFGPTVISPATWLGDAAPTPAAPAATRSRPTRKNATRKDLSEAHILTSLFLSATDGWAVE